MNSHGWLDEPPIRHGDGGTWSFVDGHSEYWKWKDPRTLTFLEYNTGIWKGVDFPDSPDIRKAQMAVWGELGYTP
jgi:prepilin-type processing-associated H-X9-DG protein